MEYSRADRDLKKLAPEHTVMISSHLQQPGHGILQEKHPAISTHQGSKEAGAAMSETENEWEPSRH